MNKGIRFIYAALVMLCASFSAYADGGVNTGYSPYSKFAIGRIGQKGTAYTQSMGGVGVAGRNHRYINTVNPAAVTARDTLAFMADFSLVQNNAYYRQGDMRSVDNTFNINSFVMSFPIWKSSAFMLGINPYSGLGYNFTEQITDRDLIGEVGNITDYRTGTGTVYETYIGAGVTFWKRLSIGAQLNFYFGNMEKSNSRNFSLESMASIYDVSDMSIKGINGKFGLQYEQPIGKDRLTLGATYKMATKLRGNAQNISYTTQNSVVDTLSGIKTINLQNVSIPDEISVGVAYNHAGKLNLEFNYSRSDWRKSHMDTEYGFKSEGFTTSVAQSFNLGFEYTPDRNDIRYYMRRVTYRAGAYYSEDYFKFSGNKVSAAAVTLGMTLPVFRWSNGLTLGVELGQRGNMRNNMVRERFANFSIGFNIYDIWFVKPKYE